MPGGGLAGVTLLAQCRARPVPVARSVHRSAVLLCHVAEQVPSTGKGALMLLLDTGAMPYKPRGPGAEPLVRPRARRQNVSFRSGNRRGRAGTERGTRASPRLLCQPPCILPRDWACNATAGVNGNVAAIVA